MKEMEKTQQLTKDAIDLSSGSVWRTFRKFFIPTLLGMLAQCALTATDGIFVGHGVGVEGVASVNITVPIFVTIAGIGLMFGTGSSVVAAIHLAQGRTKAAQLNITQGILAATVIVLLLTIPMLAFPTATARLLGCPESLLPMVREYMIWFLPGEVFSVWTALGLYAVRLDGSPKYAAWCSGAMALVNIVLDWLFIFPFGWGLMGAAFASTIAMVIGGLMTMTYICFFAKTLRPVRIKWSMNSLRYSLRNLGYQCRIGSSNLLGECAVSALAFVGNYVFAYYLGEQGVGAFGIACYYCPFVFMIGNAVAQSAQPIISFCYGLGKMQRVHETLRISLMVAVCCALTVALIFSLCPEWLVGLFIKSGSEASQIAVHGFPLFSSAFVCFLVNITFIGYYQSVERVRHSTIFSLLRGFVFLVPSFILVPHLLGVDGIWLALAVSETLTTLCIVATHFYQKRKLACQVE